MNAHFFCSKRAYHAVLRITRKPLQSFGLTAARYDLLHVLFGNVGRKSTGYTVLQSELRKRLGVCKSVVSRMLRSLERLALVRRSPYEGDTRQRRVTLTKKGLECIREARQCLMRASRRLLCIAICFGKERDRNACFQHMCALESYLLEMRRHYGDRAGLLYPWHPDD